MVRLAFLYILLAGTMLAQTTIFISRHADRFGTEPDPSLTPLGLKQAESLAKLLGPAGIRHIYTTELLRARQTGAPTAKRSGVDPVVIPQDQFDELIRQIRTTTDAPTLVIGHRQTVPKIVKALTGRDIAPLAADEYGRLVIVSLFPTGESSIVTLSYSAD